MSDFSPLGRLLLEWWILNPNTLGTYCSATGSGTISSYVMKNKLGKVGPKNAPSISEGILKREGKRLEIGYVFVVGKWKLRSGV